MLDFVIGILVAVAYYSGLALANTGTGLLLCSGLVLIICYQRLAPDDLWRVATMGAGMGCVVAAATLREKAISFGKCGSLIRLLSQQAYTMYLCHILVLKCIELAWFRVYRGWWVNVAYIIIGTLITIVVSKVLYELIEKPVTEILRRRVKRLGVK